MATSGALSTSNEYIKYKITITQNSQSVTNNTSNVTVSVKFYRTNTGYTTYGTGTVYCKINGTTYSESVTSDDEITSSGIVLFTKTLNISHSSDGTKTLTVSAWIDHQRVTSSEQSYSMTLTTIPRATTPTVNVTSADMNTSVTISMPRASSSFTHTLTYTFGSATGTIGSSLGTSKAWTIPLSLANQIPNATSGSLTITCVTYNGSTKIGTKTVKITITVPSSVVPTISSISVVDSKTDLADKFAMLIQNQSKPTVTVNASGAYSSTIASYSTKFLGVTYTAKSFTVSNLTQSGTLSIVTTIKDSRGRTATLTKNISVLAYSIPSISLFDTQRCNSDGTVNLEGQYLKITFSYSVSALNNLNVATGALSYKLTTDSSYTFLVAYIDYSVSNSTYVSTVIFDTDSSYDIRLTVSDYFKSATYNEVLSTAFTLMDFHESGKGIAIGKVAEDEGILDIGLPVRFMSEWSDLTLNSNFKVYSDNSANRPQIKNVGNIVMVKGAISPVTAFTSSTTQVEIASGIPEELRPTLNYTFVCQGSGNNKWTLGVTPSGTLTMARYGTTENLEVPTSAWLIFAVTYLV